MQQLWTYTRRSGVLPKFLGVDRLSPLVLNHPNILLQLPLVSCVRSTGGISRNVGWRSAA